jgi:hypothetical protein
MVDGILGLHASNPQPGVAGAPPATATGSHDGLAPDDASQPDAALWHAIAENHRRNRLLWAEEDLARRTRASDAEIVANKRAIDRHNQARNDAVERMDDALMILLKESVEGTAAGAVTGRAEPSRASVPQAAIATAPTPARAATPAPSAPPVSPTSPGPRLHSETPGAMIDRLSILSLKVAAMTARSLDAALDETLRAQCAARVPMLQRQRDDLAACLCELLQDVVAGRARFALYRQFKMYNDPRLNPVLAAEADSHRSTNPIG